MWLKATEKESDMSQHDFNIANQGFPAFRADLNDALLAIRSTSSGATAPTPTVAGMLWYDTATATLKQRNTANTLWVEVNSDTLPATVVRGNSSAVAAAETSLTMPTLRTMLGFPATGAGLGEWVLISTSSGAAGVLPAGGTWAYFLIRMNSPSGTINNFFASVAAGGSTVSAGVAGTIYIGFAWRIA